MLTSASVLLIGGGDEIDGGVDFRESRSRAFIVNSSLGYSVPFGLSSRGK